MFPPIPISTGLMVKILKIMTSPLVFQMGPAQPGPLVQFCMYVLDTHTYKRTGCYQVLEDLFKLIPCCPNNILYKLYLPYFFNQVGLTSHSLAVPCSVECASATPADLRVPPTGEWWLFVTYQRDHCLLQLNYKDISHVHNCRGHPNGKALKCPSKLIQTYPNKTKAV